MNIDELTLGQIKQLQSVIGTPTSNCLCHPMLGKRCLIRTYSAGVHIGDVKAIDGMEVLLENSLRLLKWEGGGLSLSSVANEGIKNGRLNKTGTIYLTQAIEFIPTTEKAEKTYAKHIEE
jgi:hypothetical protein